MIVFQFFIYLIYTYQNPLVYETTSQFMLENYHMKIGISKKEGLITTIMLDNNNIIDGSCAFYFKYPGKAVTQKVLSINKKIKNNKSICIEIEAEYMGSTIIHRYIIDTIALRWEISIEPNIKKILEQSIVFSLPITGIFKKIQNYGYRDVLELSNVNEMKFTYRRDQYIPMITGLSYDKKFGLSIIAPFELSKPELNFIINPQSYLISFHHLQLGLDKKTNAAIYIFPHKGDWRPGLDFVLNRYPEYFYPATPTAIEDGWFYLSFPHMQEDQIKSLYERKVEWIEFHEYFPFYGLYVPNAPNWGIIIDKDDIGIKQWESGDGIKQNDYKNIKEQIRLWHKYGIKFFMYYQSSEAWYQYAKKYFKDDIALDKNKNPLPSWQFTHLMNPDPRGNWGKYIINQAEEMLVKYPEIDGIFYDRMDYKDYDFAHDDGVSIINGQPAYMLAFGQKRINDILFPIFHKKKKAIWGNVPTSIEVCKGLDGIMAEKNLRHLLKLQYLGIAKPIIYKAFDGLPKDTEDKLKTALICGATISVTYGGKEAQYVESKYWPLFKLLHNRKWVLNAFCLALPAELKGNVYRTPDSNYVVIIMDPEKYQVKNHPFAYDIPITLILPDAEKINNVYLLSGDWVGINKIEMKKEGEAMEIKLPNHLATSVLYLTREKKYDLVRLSSVILHKGSFNDIVFEVDQSLRGHEMELKTPWGVERKKIAGNIVRFSIAVPYNIAGEIEITVYLTGQKTRFTYWTVDPISVVAKDDIFIHHKKGEDIFIYLTNNQNQKINLNLKTSFVQGIGIIRAPSAIILNARETKLIKVHIATMSSGSALFTAQYGKRELKFPLKVNTGLAFSNNDLFHDDFAKGMTSWLMPSGTWSTKMNIAQGSGPAHVAFNYNSKWSNYIFEACVRCRGSNNMAIDWLKSYVFFRVQNEKNYYRFGIQGNAGVLALYKRKNGQWQTLRTVPFIAEKDRWYTFRIELTGTQISCFVDNIWIMGIKDETFLNGGIGIGVLEDDMKCEYKDIVVKKL